MTQQNLPSIPLPQPEFRPTQSHILALVCSEYGVSEAKAREWLEGCFGNLVQINLLEQEVAKYKYLYRNNREQIV